MNHTSRLHLCNEMGRKKKRGCPRVHDYAKLPSYLAYTATPIHIPSMALFILHNIDSVDVSLFLARGLYNLNDLVYNARVGQLIAFVSRVTTKSIIFEKDVGAGSYRRRVAQRILFSSQDLTQNTSHDLAGSCLG